MFADSSLEDFRSLAREAPLTPVLRTILADLETPVTAYLKLTQDQGSAYSCLLESVEGGESIGRYSYIAADPFLIVRQRQGRVEQARGDRGGSLDWKPVAGSLFDHLRKLVQAHRLPEVPGAPPFLAGAVGYMGYDMVRQWEPLPEHSKDDLGLDDARFMFFSRQIIFDHARRQIHLIACADASQPARTAWTSARRQLDRLQACLRKPLPALPRRSASGRARVVVNQTPAEYQARVRRIQEYIRAGDAFQVVLSQRQDVRTRLPAIQIYRALRSINPSPYMFLLRMGEMQAVGASPEMLVNLRGDAITYRPIAGSAPRGATPAEDERLARAMLEDPKERAEHIMLVDLGRNDVGRVARYGSVKVSHLLEVDKYSHIQHLVSTVEGRLRPGRDVFDLLASCFPAGTLSGAPKVRAMQIIDELEPTRRGLYAGSVMYLDFSGNLNSCIAIRTAVLQNGWAHLQAGAGIVADSRPAREHQECLNKMQAVVRALELAGQGL